MHEVENMLYVGATPWHKLGTKFVDAPDLETAIVASGLDWQVTTEPLYTESQEKVAALATRRTSDHKILGVVGPTYQPQQNKEAFDFFKPFVESNQASIETCGSLRGGKRVFILAKLNLDPVKIVGDDEVAKYVLMCNSHDGTMAVRVGFTPIRVVCANTMSMAINSKASKLIRVRHTKNIKKNLEEVGRIMNLANAEFEASAEQYRSLAHKQINQADLEKYVKIIFNVNKKLEMTEENLAVIQNKRLMKSIIPLFEKGRGNNMPNVKGTYWAAYNAVVEYLQYNRGNDETHRLDQMWFGQGANLNRKALTTAIKMSA